MRPSPRVIVVAPGAPGLGGLGAAARDMATGLRECGASVRHVTLPDRPTALQAAARRRPLRRLAVLGRAVDRRTLAAQVPDDWDVAYSMPGFAPRGERARSCVVHAATHHPARVRESLAVARRRAGGGQSFMTAIEADMLVRELRRARVVRAESVAVAEELRADTGLRGAVVVAPPGVDLERFRPGIKAAELTVAFVGTFSLWKGIDVLVDLGARLRGVAALATIAGPVCPWSRRMAAGAPFVPHGDVPHLLAKAHALVLPSASDGFGYVVLEAMAAGAVPFVTPEVGASELVARLDRRLILPAADFAEGVGALLTTLPLAELARAARGLACEFEQTAMARRAAAAVLDALE